MEGRIVILECINGIWTATAWFMGQKFTAEGSTMGAASAACYDKVLAYHYKTEMERHQSF